MHFGPRASRFLAAPLLLLAISLPVVALLQYRSLRSVRDAERKRSRDQVRFAVQRSADELSRMVRRVFREFLAPGNVDVAALRRQWLRDSTHPDLIGVIHVAGFNGDAWLLRRLDPKSEDLVDVSWPVELEPVRHELDVFAERGPDALWPGPLFAAVPAIMAIQQPSPGDPAPVTRPGRAVIINLDRRALAAILRESLDASHTGRLDAALLAGSSILGRTSEAWPDGKRVPDVTYAFRPAPPPPRYQPPSAPRPGDEVWQVSVRQHGSELETILTRTYRRNLALALVNLLMLAASAVMLMILLQRGERLRAQQARFVAAMSHELNTPLAVLRIASENLHDGITHDPEKVSRYMRTIARETANLSEMVNDVLELAGLNAGVSTAGNESVDVGTVIEEAVMRSRLAGRGEEIEFDFDVERDLPPVRGNEQALARAVQNLVTNAMRHGAEGRWVGVHVRRADEAIRIAVEDRGPGIDPADAAHIFEPFYRGSASGNIRGTGLGLAIVRQIVLDHGGSVAMSARPGGGAAFIINLPAGTERA